MTKKELLAHLTKDIIPFWNSLIDIENGGFYGYADSNGVPKKKLEKGVILNNRILWFYSNAYMLLKEKSLLKMAEHAHEFLTLHLADYLQGGIYWSVDYQGNPLDTEKHTYNQAFGVYALASYYDATKDPDVLNQAMKIYATIESICKDDNGYLEAFDRFWNPSSNEKLSENGVMATRTMNTLLHIIEAYTELYRVSKNEDVKKSLIEALDRFYTKIWNPKLKRCEVFFDEDYNTLIDLQSYGHDIEASWLITRACQVLDDKKLLDSYMDMITGLVDSTYERGMRDHSSMYYECENGVDLEKRTWWVQAESVIGFYNCYQLTGNQEYKDTAFRVFDFIMNNIVDKNTGEWIEDYWDDPKKNEGQDLVQPWKCPYHNGRMLIEMIKRLSNNVSAPENCNEDAKALYYKLKDIINENRFLFGHQNSISISVNKSTDSDVRMMVNDIPGLIGLDTLALAGNEMNPESQEDSLRRSIEVCQKAHDEGAVITLSAHMPNFASPKIIHENGKILFNKCDFMDCKQIDDSYKEILPGGKYYPELKAFLDLIAEFFLELQKRHIPVIFRPYHEQNGHWFWWGGQTDKKYYIKNFRYLKEYLLEKGVRNVLWAYSPNPPFHNEEDYLDRYPGDDIIDIMALDYYDDYLYGEPYRKDFFKLLDFAAMTVYKCALAHDKIPAISECGIRVSKTPENNDFNGYIEHGNPMCGKRWFNMVGEVALKYNMPYYLIWGNFEVRNCYLPFYYPDGTPHEMMDDFKEFYKWDKPIFAHKK